MIYICIPVHNEERTAGVLLWKIREVMREFDRDYRVLLLNDASTDETAKVIERYKSLLPVDILDASTRMGYASAQERLLREAMARSSYPKRDVVVTLQGDFTEDPAHIISLVKVIEGGADIVSGLDEERGVGRPAGMRFARWAVPLLLRSLYREAPVADPVSGLRAYRVIVLRKAFQSREIRDPTAGQDRWSANLRLLLEVARYARRIEEAPGALRYDIRVRESRFQPLSTLRSLLRFREARWGAPATEVAR